MMIFFASESEKPSNDAVYHINPVVEVNDDVEGQLDNSAAIEGVENSSTIETLKGQSIDRSYPVDAMISEDTIAYMQEFVDAMYRDFLDELYISDDQKHKMKELLAKRKAYEIQGKMNMLQLFDQKDSSKISGATERIVQIDKAISELISNDEFEKFQQHEKTEPERLQVLSFNDALGEEDALTFDQKRLLIDLMYDARMNDPELAKMKIGAPSSFTPEDMDNYMALNDRYLESIEYQSSFVLTQKQMDIVFD